MTQNHVQLVDLPNEILFLILKKLDNIDVLYSFFGISNQRLEILIQEKIFSKILNFISGSKSCDQNSMLDRFCSSILPRVHLNVKCLIVDSLFMERILRAGNYPNLTTLQIYNFNRSINQRYFMDDCLFGHICKKQITDLVLLSNEKKKALRILEDYNTNFYAIFFEFFENLKHLCIRPTFINDYPPVPICSMSPMTFSSSILTKLCVHVYGLGDVYALLGGRLKQLITLIVQVDNIRNGVVTSSNRVDAHNLKCLSLISYPSNHGYENGVLPLLRQLTCLEELTLYVHIMNGSKFLSGIDLDNKILIHMPRLHAFTFYIAATIDISDPDSRISNFDIEQTFANMKYGQVISMMDNSMLSTVVRRIFSLPFKFHRLEDIGNNIPDIRFNSVTYLTLQDVNGFKHEFFVRLTRAFPFVQKLCIYTRSIPHWRPPEFHLYEQDWCSIIEYPHLISLNIKEAAYYYVERFLNETKTRLIRLTELEIHSDNLKRVTNNFTRGETRRNCSNINQLIIRGELVDSKDVENYFPLLTSQSYSDIF